MTRHGLAVAATFCLALGLLCFLWCPTGLADATLWHTYVDAGRKAQEQGQYLEAQRMFEAALKEVENIASQDVRLADTLAYLAAAHYAQGQYPEAGTVLKRAMGIYEKSQQLDEVPLSFCLNDLAAVCEARGNYPEAQPLYERALGIFNKQLGSDKANVAAIYNNLANLAVSQGRTSSAAPVYSKALAIYEQIPGADNDVAMALSNLGLLYCRQGQYESAEQLLKRAMDLREKLLSPDHPDVAVSWNNMGLVSLLQKKVSQAEDCFKKALSIWEKALGANHPDVALCLNNLGNCSVASGKYPQAETFYKKAIVLREKLLGPEHPDLAVSLFDLGELYRTQGKLSDADPLYTRALAIRQKAFSSEHPLVALSRTGLALIKDEQGKDLEVEDKWALIVGISKYKDSTINLKYAAKDATDFCNYLIKQGRFAADHVKLLTDEKATRENILAYLGDTWLPKVASPGDLVVIYISSHGSPSQLDVAGVNYIVAHDTNPRSLYATGIPLQDLNRIVKDRVHCHRVVLILDACHSGAATAQGKGLMRISNFNAQEIVQGTGQLVICSSEPHQMSWESNKYPNGVFTRQLIEALSCKGPKTELGTAYEFMKDKVQQEVLRDRGELQTPVLVSAWKGHDLLLAVPPARPRPGLTTPEQPQALPGKGKGPGSPFPKSGRVKPSPVVKP